jgi:hypothetical protein
MEYIPDGLSKKQWDEMKRKEQEDLKKRVAELEAMVGKKPTAKKPAAKKATPKIKPKATKRG